MAKGDSANTQHAIDYRGNMAQGLQDNLRGNLLPQNQQLQNRFNTSADQSTNDYNKLMGQYGGFAQTGGFSPQDIQDLRARAIAPTRAVYANAQSNIDRQRSLQGYSPNYTAATAKLTRDLANSTSDANVNANASIAQAVQQGKLAGMQGEGQTYAATPGTTNMFGNQLGQSNSQMNTVQELQNQIMNAILGAQINQSKIPGNYQQALGNIGGTLGLAGQIADPLSNIFGGTQSPLSATQSYGPVMYGMPGGQ